MSVGDDLNGIQFGLLTDEEIRNLAVLEVTDSTLHTKGHPKAGGPIDTRFGTCSRFTACGTCKNTLPNCPGHPGFISLPYPIPHVAFIGYLTRFLNVFCFNCSHFLLPPDYIPATICTAKNRLHFAYDECRKARGRKRTPLVCLNPECGLPQPTVYIEEPFVRLTWRDDILRQFFGVATPPVVAATEPPPPKKRKRKGTVVTPVAEPVPVVETGESRCRREQLEADYNYFVLRPFNNWDAYNVLRSIRKSDLALLGIDGNHTHPAGFMLLSLLVPAIGVRPTVSFEEGSRRRGYHHLTKKISEIVKLKRILLTEASNAKIRLDDEALTVLPPDVAQALLMLYVTISHYMVKDKCKVPGMKMSPYAARAHARLQSITATLTGKKGRYRDTLMGKRVDFCVRTVVGPLPDGDIDEIGFPAELAKRLSINVRVNQHNREALTTLMRAGGVLQLLDPASGEMIAINAYNKDTMVLPLGITVERFLRNGDWIPINRQPTLHRPSMLAFRVRIHKHLTFKLPPPCTPPFNADHDGDEMNGHIPQTVEARAEAQELMAVSKHIMHPRANKPIMGIIQDGCDAGYFLTHLGTFLTRSEMMDLLVVVRYNRDSADRYGLGDPLAELQRIELPVPAIVRSAQGPLWTGKQLLSCVLPRINMHRKIKNRPKIMGDPWLALDGRLVIRRGHLLMGTCCKQTLGDAAGGIIHMACLYGGNNIAARFISDVQRILNKYLIRVGFSVGIRDCCTDDRIQEKIQTLINAAEAHIATITALGAEMPQDPEVQDLTEAQLCNTLKALLLMVGNVVRANLVDDNMLNIMSNIVGSKGTAFNLAQILGWVGQTFVNGRRPAAMGSGRVLPSAPLVGQKLLSLHEQLQGRGLIDRPYKAGLSMPAAFLHNMGGREGLVDTAAKTSETGYVQRRTVKAMESHHIAYDGTVRDAYQNVYQLCFGADGLDPCRLGKIELASLLLSNEELRGRCMADTVYSMENVIHQLTWINEWTTLLSLRDEVRRAKITNFQQNLSQNIHVYLPFDVAVLLEEQQQRCRRHTHTPSSDVVLLMQTVQDLCTTLNQEVPSVFTCYHIRDEMSSGRLCGHWQLCSDCVVKVAQHILKLHRAARLQPGEGVGALTATSLGEPCTQMTLNSVAWATLVQLHYKQKDGSVQTKVVPLGQYVDELMAQSPNAVQHQPNGAEWLPLAEPVKVLSVDLAGQWSYELVEGVSRHGVCNADGSTEVLKVRTGLHREVVATLGESFLRCEQGDPHRLAIVLGANLQIGDYVPVLHLAQTEWTVKTDWVATLERLPAAPTGDNGTVGKMYDLTVANTKNFVLANGLAVRDTFHQAGTAKTGMTYGVPRLREIICASRNILTPCTTLILKLGLGHTMTVATLLARTLPFTLLRTILQSTELLFEPDLSTTHCVADHLLVKQHAPFLQFIQARCCPWIIRFTLCKTRAGSRSLEPRAVANLIQDYLQDRALVIASRAEDTHWVIRVYLIDITSVVDQALKKSLETGTTRTANKRLSANTKRRRFTEVHLTTPVGTEATSLPVPLHRIDAAIGQHQHTARDVIQWMVVRNIQQDLRNTLCVGGIEGITAADVRQSERTIIDPLTGALTLQEEWVVDVKGTNFVALAMLPEINMSLIYTNDVMAAYDTLGIDAAAHVLFQELQACLSASGARVDDRLIKLLVDVMTHHGFVMPISRHGLNRLVEHGVLAKITFEETLEMLFEAAALGHFDPLLGVSENVMTGRQPLLGTNLSKMYIDRDGQRQPCQQLKQSSLTQGGIDNRILISVVTEEEEEEDQPRVDPATADLEAEWETSLDQTLTTHAIYSVQSAENNRQPVLSEDLYQQKLYHSLHPNAVMEPTAPFRPSSPTWYTDEPYLTGNHVGLFRPTSPDLD